MRKSKNKRARRRRKLLLCFVVLVVFVIGLFGFYSYQLSPVGDGTNEVLFEIEDGQTYDEVLNNLEDDQLIRSATFAKIYSRLSSDDVYYAGNFDLNDGMSTKEVLSYISEISNAEKEQVTLVVPEGKWAKEIAELIAEQYPDYTADEIIDTWNDSDYIKTLAKDYDFLDAKTLNNSEYNVKLEGYLFPNTYSLNATATIDEITRTMLDQFELIYEKYKDDFDASDYSIQEIVTLASIVQFEASSTSDMKKIAGVFYNRLDDDMKLQSSVTVCYALYDEFEDPEDCEVNTDIESPYNTYLNDGIPIGPILNPGEAAIQAVLEPDEHDYLYFLADINGDGTVYYSETLEEHEEKMEELGLVLE